MKIVTAVYELQRLRQLGHYRAVEAAYIRAFRQLPASPDIDYVLYTDEHMMTVYKSDMERAMSGKSVDLRILNLNDSVFKPKVTVIKERLFAANADYYEVVDKHSCVENYVELMLEKFNMVHDNITDEDEQVFWLDAGLFLNSCNFPWRPWIEDNCSTPLFFQKLSDFVGQDFLLFQSLYMPHGHGQLQHLREIADSDKGSELVISGGLWGGGAIKTKEITQELIANANALLDRGINTSDQECLTISVMRNPDNFKILNFEQWDDYQKNLITIFGKYNPLTYDKNYCNL
jgi:hypothetical protein